MVLDFFCQAQSYLGLPKNDGVRKEGSNACAPWLSSIPFESRYCSEFPKNLRLFEVNFLHTPSPTKNLGVNLCSKGSSLSLQSARNFILTLQ